MTGYHLSQLQREILERLLGRRERTATSRGLFLKVSEEAFPEYFRDHDPPSVRGWQDGVESLAALGWIELAKGRGSASHRIERIRLLQERISDIETALGRLGLDAFRAQLASALHNAEGRFELRGGLRSDERWLRFKERETSRWQTWNPDAARRLMLLEEAQLTFDTVAELASPGGARDTSWRQFSDNVRKQRPSSNKWAS